MLPLKTIIFGLAGCGSERLKSGSENCAALGSECLGLSGCEKLETNLAVEFSQKCVREGKPTILSGNCRQTLKMFNQYIY